MAKKLMISSTLRKKCFTQFPSVLFKNYTDGLKPKKQRWLTCWLGWKSLENQ